MLAMSAPRSEELDQDVGELEDRFFKSRVSQNEHVVDGFIF
jgi:hypothetical protein